MFMTVWVPFETKDVGSRGGLYRLETCQAMNCQIYTLSILLCSNDFAAPREEVKRKQEFVTCAPTYD